MPMRRPGPEEVFHRARGLSSQREREAYLLGACADDLALRSKVEALLKADAEAGSFLASGHHPSESPSASPPHEQAGAMIGRYKLLQQIGEGGFGTVWMAEQKQPVRRKVALKIIKLGMDTRQVIARFEAERQALAMMDHPNIATVLDAGATKRGRPYFVMELVKGVPVTEYCDGNHLTVQERLDLFLLVCSAVQHAHQKGIIHRDIKPSNVLVTLHDGVPVPKVIDFGIAKATSAELTERTLFTEHGQMIGTPVYMSPEQAEMSGLDIDTRSDIYSLGVLLYELLTGTKPLAIPDLREAGFAEIQRIIREQEPPKPSTRISTLDKLPSIAAHRRIEPEKLGLLIRGDLDWIIMKAMEKERTRRYETANGFAADLRRHLNDEPVLASPPSAAYRLHKFVRRNRVIVGAGSLVVLSLLAAVAVSGSFALSEARQRREADRERSIARAVNDFLNKDLLAAVAPSGEKGMGRDVLMREVLDVAAKRITAASGPAGRFEDKPLVEASIRMTLGETYRLLGKYSAAESHLTTALELRSAELGAESENTLESMNALAGLYLNQGRSDEAEPLLLEVLEICKRVLSETHPDTLGSMNNLAILYKHQGRYDEAEALDLTTIEIQKQVLGAKHRDTLGSMNNLANLYRQQGRYDEAEPLLRKVLEIQERVLGAEDLGTLMSMHNLALLYSNQGRSDEAEPLFLEVIDLRTRILSAEHPDTVASMNDLAVLYHRQGRYSKAEPLFLEVLAIRKRVLGKSDPDTLGSMHNLAVLYERQGRSDEAEALDLTIIEIQKQVLGAKHRDTLGSMNNLANLYRQQGRYDEAEPLLRKVLKIQKRVLGAEDPGTLMSMHNLALLCFNQGRSDEAEPMFLEVIDIRKRVLGESDPDTLGSMNNLAVLYKGQGRYVEAETLNLTTIEIRKQALGAEHRNTLGSMNNLANLYRQQGRYDEAEPLLRKVLKIQKRVLGAEDPGTLMSMHNLALLCFNQGRSDEAEPMFLEVIDTRQRVLGAENPYTLKSISVLADLYEKQGRLDEALPLRRELLDHEVSQAKRPEATSSELNDVAWKLLTSKVEAFRDPSAARTFALRACELTDYRTPTMLDTLAMAYHLTGGHAKAVEIQERAVALLSTEAPRRDEYEDHLARFEAALRDGR